MQSPLLALEDLLQVALVGLLAVLSLRTIVALLLHAAGRLPGAWGQASAQLADRVTPAVIRRAAAAVLAMGAWTLVAATGARAMPEPAAGAAITAGHPHAGVDALDRGPLGDPEGTGRTRGATAWVVVRPGDSLWSIAARHLGAGATEAEVAAEWPRWWAANRHRIGPDPAALHPGQRLRPPPLGAHAA